MAYCLYTDVQSDFKSIAFSSSTAVTDTEVSEFIAQADAYIDSKIGLRYSTPVDGGAVALSLLKSISIAIVRRRIIKILASKTGVTEPDQLEQEEPEYEEILNALASGKMVLPGADLVASGDGVASYNLDNDITQTFNVTDTQW